MSFKSSRFLFNFGPLEIHGYTIAWHDYPQTLYITINGRRVWPWRR